MGPMWSEGGIPDLCLPPPQDAARAHVVMVWSHPYWPKDKVRKWLKESWCSWQRRPPPWFDAKVCAHDAWEGDLLCVPCYDLNFLTLRPNAGPVEEEAGEERAGGPPP